MKWIRNIELPLSSDVFSLEKTFECGQCFRWNRISDAARSAVCVSLGISRGRAAYAGVVDRSVLIAVQGDAPSTMLMIFGEDLPDERIEWYLNLRFDYEEAARILSEGDESAGTRRDEVMRAACAYGAGMRLLRQPLFETAVSFIVSANNNIPKIKMSVESWCRIYGEFLGRLPAGTVGEELAAREWYAFPEPGAIAARPDGVREARAIGYRARPVAEAAMRAASGEIDLEGGRALCYEDLVHDLMRLRGVGRKVADCIALYGYGCMDAFPVDTWVKKGLADLYGVSSGYERFAAERFPRHRGLAQQYLFYYIRGISGK